MSKMQNVDGNIFVFVIWSAARTWEPQIMADIERRFKVVRSFEVSWRRRFFVRNLASFYGWKGWFIWRNKARKCGTGPFRVIVVEDPAPVWRHERDTFGHELLVDENVYRLKKSFRAMTGHSNIVHSSVTAEETAHQLSALDSPEQSPIPFRRMVYADDARIRAGRRRVWIGMAVDILAPVAAAMAAGLIVWADVSIFGTNCAENGIVEWTGLLFSALCGFLMTVCAVRQKPGRGAHALFAAFFLDMAIREADQLLNEMLGTTLWAWGLTVVTIAFAAVTVRYAKTVYSGLRAVRRSRFFSHFTCGAALMLFVSQFLERPAIWRTLGVADAPSTGHFVEESVELFGYVLMAVWTVSYAWRTLGDRGADRAVKCGIIRH